jgi:PAS domain S-box-containing protein
MSEAMYGELEALLRSFRSVFGKAADLPEESKRDLFVFLETHPDILELVIASVEEREQIDQSIDNTEYRHREFLDNLIDPVYELQPFKEDVSEEEEAMIRAEVEQIGQADEESLDKVAEQAAMKLFPFIDGTITYANRAASEMLGHSRDRLNEIKMHALIIPLQYPAAMRNMFKIFKQKDQRGLLYTLVTADNRSVEVSINAAWTDDKFPFKILGVVRDITERKKAEADRARAEEALTESEARYRSFVENFPGIAYRGKMDFTPIFFHGSVEEITGYTEEEFLAGDPRWDEIIHPDDRERIYASGVSSEVCSEERECRIRRKDGKVRWVHERIQSMAGEDEKPEYVQGIIIDITDRKNAEEEGSKLEKQLAQAARLESLGRLAGGVAHDFNNTLMVMRGLAEIEVDGLKSLKFSRGQLYKDLTNMIKAADKGASTTKQMLSFARVGAYEPANMDINLVVEDVLPLMERGVASTVPYNLVCQTDAKKGISADATQVHQVLHNLALNARDAMPEGGTITLATENMTLDNFFKGRIEEIPPGDYVVLTVSDEGTGISDEEMEKIFEPFYTTKATGKGTGLGLASVWGIAKRHNAYVDVESEENKGATFRIYFPATMIEEECVKKEKHSVRQARKGTVLVVEDQELVREVVKRGLEGGGYDVVTATQGDEGFERYCEGGIDMVLTDVTMPGGMSCRELFHKIRAAQPDAKIGIMSGHPMDENVQYLNKSGAKGYIAKPFTMETLLNFIDKIMDE